MREHWLMRWLWDVEKVRFRFIKSRLSFLQYKFYLPTENWSQSTFSAQNEAEHVHIEVGGRWEFLPAALKCLPQPFNRRNGGGEGDLPPGDEKGLSLYHIINFVAETQSWHAPQSQSWYTLQYQCWHHFLPSFYMGFLWIRAGVCQRERCVCMLSLAHTISTGDLRAC